MLRVTSNSAGRTRPLIRTLCSKGAGGGGGDSGSGGGGGSSSGGGSSGDSSSKSTSTSKSSESSGSSSSETPKTPKGFQEGGGDIAFKPTTDGWGYAPAYASGWDRIFAKKAEAPPQPEAPPQADAPPPRETEAKLAALEHALEVGALSKELYERARREVLD